MLCDRLKDIMFTRDISIAELAEMSSLPLETVRNIYYGKTSDPKVSTVMQISNALDMSVNCLMGDCIHTVEERTIIQYYRNCGRHGKSIIQLVAKYEATTAKSERESADSHKIPCLIAKGNLHDGIVYDSCEVVDIITGVKDAYVGIQLTTNDLAPIYCKDDIVLIANRFPSNGEYAVFYIGDKAYIRQFFEEDNKYRLHCIHDICPDLILKRMNLEYIGTCIGVARA